MFFSSSLVRVSVVTGCELGVNVIPVAKRMGNILPIFTNENIFSTISQTACSYKDAILKLKQKVSNQPFTQFRSFCSSFH